MALGWILIIIFINFEEICEKVVLIAIDIRC